MFDSPNEDAISMPAQITDLIQDSFAVGLLLRIALIQANLFMAA